MFNSNDIYTYLMNGGDPEDLHKKLYMTIEEANKKVAAAKEAEKKEKELADKINKARDTAFKALKSYFALVNPNVTEDVISSVLDTLETVEIKVNEIRGKCDDRVGWNGPVTITDEEWKAIWNTLFPFNFKRK